MTSTPARLMDTVARPPASPGRRSSPLTGSRITFRGVVTSCVVVLVAVASFTSEANLLLLLCGISSGLLLLNLIACTQMIRKIEVERVISSAAAAGRPFRLAYVVRNKGRWLRAWALRLSEAQVSPTSSPLGHAFILALGPGEEHRCDLTTVFPVRGRARLRGLRVSCGFPFGFFTSHVEIESSAEIVVYPTVGRVRREFWHQQLLSDAASSRRIEQVSGPDEFHGVREYRSGDNPRWIHWRRSARTGQLVVREHETPRDSQLAVLVDPWPGTAVVPRSGRGMLSRLFGGGSDFDRDPQAERVISAAATAVCEALDRGHRVGLVCRAAVPVVVAPAGGRSHRQRLLQELAMLSPGADRPLGQLVGAIRWSAGWNARCLVFTTKADEEHGRVLRLLNARSQSVTLVSPQSGWLDRLFEIGPPAEERRAAS